MALVSTRIWCSGNDLQKYTFISASCQQGPEVRRTLAPPVTLGRGPRDEQEPRCLLLCCSLHGLPSAPMSCCRTAVLAVPAKFQPARRGMLALLPRCKDASQVLHVPLSLTFPSAITIDAKEMGGAHSVLGVLS